MHTKDVDAADNELFIRAVAELQSVIGPHAVYKVDFDHTKFPVKLFVDLIPALRHASEIGLQYFSGSSPTLEENTEIVSLFERPQRIGFLEIPVETLVAFLGSACASKLKEVEAIGPIRKNAEVDVAQENVIFGSCFDFTNLEQGQSKQMTLIGWNVRWDFLRRLIEVPNTPHVILDLL